MKPPVKQTAVITETLAHHVLACNKKFIQHLPTDAVIKRIIEMIDNGTLTLSEEEKETLDKILS